MANGYGWKCQAEQSRRGKSTVVDVAPTRQTIWLSDTDTQQTLTCADTQQAAVRLTKEHDDSPHRSLLPKWVSEYFSQVMFWLIPA
jgi:hypothetical protein